MLGFRFHEDVRRLRSPGDQQQRQHSEEVRPMVWKGSVRRLFSAILGLFLLGCSDDETDPVGGMRDVSTSDTGSDSGPADSGSDAGVDSGQDTGVDSGVDGGTEDTGFNDAGGGGGFTERSIDMSGVHGQGVEVLDFEGDGDLDVI